MVEFPPLGLAIQHVAAELGTLLGLPYEPELGKNICVTWVDSGVAERFFKHVIRDLCEVNYPDEWSRDYENSEEYQECLNLKYCGYILNNNAPHKDPIEWLYYVIRWIVTFHHELVDAITLVARTHSGRWSYDSGDFAYFWNSKNHHWELHTVYNRVPVREQGTVKHYYFMGVSAEGLLLPLFPETLLFNEPVITVDWGAALRDSVQ